MVNGLFERLIHMKRLPTMVEILNGVLQALRDGQTECLEIIILIVITLVVSFYITMKVQQRSKHMR